MKISCLRASELSSKALDEELTFGEKALMYFHNILCAFCTQFKKQAEFISKLFKSESALDAGPTLSREARERLKQVVHSQVTASRR